VGRERLKCRVRIEREIIGTVGVSIDYRWGIGVGWNGGDGGRTVNVKTPSPAQMLSEDSAEDGAESGCDGPYCTDDADVE
jgi:hypothetical protein